MTSRTRIAGTLDLDALARLHRPTDRNTLRAAATELRQRGLMPRDIGDALGISEHAVRDLFGEVRT